MIHQRVFPVPFEGSQTGMSSLKTMSASSSDRDVKPWSVALCIRIFSHISTLLWSTLASQPVLSAWQYIRLRLELSFQIMYQMLGKDAELLFTLTVTDNRAIRHNHGTPDSLRYLP